MILRFLSDCVWARLEGECDEETADRLDASLSFYEPGYFYSRLYKLHRWDGKKHLFDRQTMTFPAGLAHRIRDVVTITAVFDERPSFTFREQPPSLNGVTMFEDQLEAFHCAVHGLRGCLCLATGFGKTEVAAAIAQAAKPARGIFLVNKKALMAQTADRFEERLGEKVGRLGGGLKQTNRRVTVATLQTVHAHLGAMREWLADQKFVIYDEAHTIAPGMSFPVLQAIHAPVRLGLSATIKEAGRRMAVEAFLGPILIERNARELIQAGRATPAYVKMIQVGGLVAECSDFGVLYDAGIVQNEQRNAAVVRAFRSAVARGLKTLGLVVRINHGDLLARELGVPFLHGGSSLDAIQEAKRDFARGRIPGMLASTIFDMGQDIPTLECLIMAGGGNSPLRTIQRIGRALRIAPGKTEAEIVDFYDLSNEILRKHSAQRKTTYERKGFPVWITADKIPVA